MRDRVREMIRAGIVDCRYSPGERSIAGDEQLAEIFVSRHVGSFGGYFLAFLCSWPVPSNY